MRKDGYSTTILPVETTEELNGHQIRSNRSTEALIHAAGDLIAEGGYQAMTLAMVGERAGYSRSLATARFGSKAQLLEALVDTIVVRWSVEKIAPQEEGLDGLARLKLLLLGIRDSYQRSPRSLRILYALIFEALGPPPELHDRFVTFNQHFIAQITTYIQKGIEDGSISADHDPSLFAASIVAQLRGVGYLWQLDPDRIDPAAVLTNYIDGCLLQLAGSHAPPSVPSAS